ncbi:hypothetical protein P3G55_18840, partial [Leptospira sp. 96542]|nr:hypothetical protein [Leptospira sp. 96542]
MTARSDAQNRHERVITLVLEIDADRCTNTYGVSPCTAAAGVGNECYNTFATCQDRANFARGTVTKRFCSRGTIVPGETVRPYISKSASVTPTEIDPNKGLAMRSQTSIKLLDEPAPDHLEDPYAATRPQPAQGGFWPRFLARNPNLAGRPARVLRGYVVQPWDWDVFQTERFIIEAVRGPDGDGSVTVVLTDVLKIADRNVLPAATDGKLQTDLQAVADAGLAQAGGSSTITLRANASAVDDAYNGMEVWIYEGVGSGQRGVITDYVGSSRVATVTPAWAVPPTSASAYQVSALSINVGAGKGAQYADPATSGKEEYIRIGEEIIRYRAKTGDVLSWPTAEDRAQFGTTRADQKAEEAVQLCRAWISKRPWEVMRDICVESGIDEAFLPLADWETEDGDWFNGAEITAILSEPEKASALLAELLQDLNAMAWWDPVAQQVKMLANQPIIGGDVGTLTDDNFILNSTAVEVLDAQRITQSALYFNLRDATATRTESKNYANAAIGIDVDAQGANEYGDTRPSVARSRWLSGANTAYAQQAISRRLARLRNAPIKLTAKLDPKDEVALGSMLTAKTARHVNAAGAPKSVLCRVTRLKDAGTHFELSLLAAGYRRKRYAFIAPNGLPDYTLASEAQQNYAYICGETGL